MKRRKKEYQRKYQSAHREQRRKYKREWSRRKRHSEEKEVSKLNPLIISHDFKEEQKVCPICRAKERDKRWLLTNYCSLCCYSLWLKNKKNNKDSGQWYRNIFVET